MFERWRCISGLERAVLPAAAALAMSALWPAVGTGQEARDGQEGEASAAGNEIPRLPSGRPNFEGTWTNKTITPFERPEELGEKAFFTPEEADRFVQERLERGDRDNRTDDVNDVLNAYNEFWWDSGNAVLPNLRTSIVTDPPNGRIPPLTAERKAELEAEAEAIAERCKEPGCAVTNSGDVAPADEPQQLDLMSRCISFGTVVPMLPTAYNNNYQIVQGRDSVAIVTEMVHQARHIPTAADAPPAPSQVRQWFGNSRGYWDGDTLVVETTNFKGELHGRLSAADENLRVVERFTLASPDVLVYEFTVDDPTVWTRPWSGEIPLTRSDGLLYEYACHEGNRGMENILRAARAEIREAAAEEDGGGAGGRQ